MNEGEEGRASERATLATWLLLVLNNRQIGKGGPLAEEEIFTIIWSDAAKEKMLQVTPNHISNPFNLIVILHFIYFNYNLVNLFINYY